MESEYNRRRKALEADEKDRQKAHDAEIKRQKELRATLLAMPEAIAKAREAHLVAMQGGASTAATEAIAINLEMAGDFRAAARWRADSDEARLQKRRQRAIREVENLTIDVEVIWASFTDQLANSLAGALSDALASVFDPSKHVSLLELFANLAKGLANTIFQELSRALAQVVINFVRGLVEGIASALAKEAAFRAVTGIVGAAAGAAGGGPGTGAGAVAGQWPWSGSHAGGPVRPRGFSGGGIVPAILDTVMPFARPGDIHPADTVPAWLQPREWVLTAQRVAMLGQDVVAAIHSGLISPGILRAVYDATTDKRTVVARSSKGPGYFMGGEVRSVSGTGPSAGGGSGGGGLTRAYIVSDEQAAERMLAGGRNAQMDFYRQNRDSIKQALGLGRF
jgi:hypothetical protein